MGGLLPQPTATSKTNSSGGITPEQQMLAQYQFGEGVIGDAAQYGGPNAGNVGEAHSTNATQAVGGTRFNEAFQAAQMSDADYKAMLAFNQSKINATEAAAGQAGGAAGAFTNLFGGGGGGGGGSSTG